ncbi:peptidoglycan-binding protein [Myxococcus sp. RHSTA-1-4]|uniref:peptidoglycan-binding protein n=1 Tax=Myxococcus sp. RHSTA-1-4 TaxID=2874601 RepID=UPI001CC02880|nr:peptidoglycan-binding protein [Myxococcus sp. RHSTA-1-4]MBZ4421262.1 peptidoglycan-binding protein [Myxococcus sp. RHSTA-1-4]
MKGAAVRQLQTDLVKLGFMTQSQMDTGPGTFGPRTLKALKDFQSAKGLSADGIYGPRTREALQRAMSGGGTQGTQGKDGFDDKGGPSTRPSTPPPADRPKPGGLLGRAYADNSQKAANAKLSTGGRYAAELRSIANLSPQKRRQIDEIARKADLPPALVAGIWYREASFRDGVYLHNGDPLGTPTTHVPKGIFFRKDQFVEAAVHALREKRSTQKELNLHYNSTDLGAMATYAEAYNGYGYRNKGVTSPYSFAGTDQYRGGMYVADGKYSASTYDRRLGIVAIAKEYMRHG